MGGLLSETPLRLNKGIHIHMDDLAEFGTAIYVWLRQSIPLPGNPEFIREIQEFARMACHDNIRTLSWVQLQKLGCIVGNLNPSKTERIDVRTNSSVKQLLQDAARACHKNVSEFLLDAGVTAANQALADRRHFVFNEEQWQAFQDALDRPVQAKPRLKKLLREAGILG